MEATPTNFLDYSLPDYNFSMAAINDFHNSGQLVQPTLPVWPSLYSSESAIKANYYIPSISYTPPVVATIQPTLQVQPVAKKTISFTVADATETLPGANIAINGVGTAQTDNYGLVTLPNIPIDAVIKITYVGYKDYIVSASAIPNKVIMTVDALELKEVVLQNNYKKPTSNTWAWWLLGGLAAVGIYKYSKTGAKVVRAKI